MITAFRRLTESLPVRILLGVLAMAFVVWGVGDVIRQVGFQTWLVKAGGQTIAPQQFQATFQRVMSQAERKLPAGQDVTPALRQQVAEAALQQTIGEAAMTQELARLRIVVPDAALRQAVFSMPEFRGTNGQFDRSKLDAVLQNNNLSEPEFLDIMRSQIAGEQLMSAITAGAGAPSLLTDKLFDFAQEQRSALMTEFPFAAQPAPPAPTTAEQQRWYDDHPWLYTVPEFRRIKAVVLTPESIAKTMTASDAELHAYYDAHKAEFVTPERRSVQVLVLHDAGKAQALAKEWQGGSTWEAMQKAAAAAGGSAVEVNDTTDAGLPDPALAKAAFAAAVNEVSAPVQTALGWDVVKVTKVTPGLDRSFASVKDEISTRVLTDQAAAKIYDAVNKLDDILGTGIGLDKLPSDLGLVGVQGTLDADGATREGTPAPIPGPPELRKALIEAAFKAPVGQPPAQLVEVPVASGGTSSFYALTVEQVFPPARKPLDEVKDQVTADWTEAAREKSAERAATALLTGVQGGKPLADAAAVAGVTVRQTPPMTRGVPAEGVPASLQRVLFGLQPKEPAMVQTGDGFVVAVPDQIRVPSPKDDQAAYDTIAGVLSRSIGADLASAFDTALRARANPRVNHDVFESFVNNGQ